MPVLYLLDSIVKNFGGQYMKLFTNRLIAVFMCIFEKVFTIRHFMQFIVDIIFECSFIN